jgi:hypothetical protein
MDDSRERAKGDLYLFAEEAERLKRPEVSFGVGEIVVFKKDTLSSLLIEKYCTLRSQTNYKLNST